MRGRSLWGAPSSVAAPAAGGRGRAPGGPASSPPVAEAAGPPRTVLAFGPPERPVVVEVEGRPPAGLDRLFVPLRCAAAGVPARRLRVARTGGGLLLDGEPHASEGELLSVLEHRLALLLLEAEPRLASLHAAGAVTAAGAVLGLGPSGCGKSSLALEWSLAGLPILGDDTVRVDGAGRVRSFPRLVKVDRDRWTGAGRPLDATVAPDPGYSEVWFDPADAGGWATGAHRVAVLARVRFEAGAAWRLTPRTPAEGLRFLVDHVQPVGVAPPEALDRLIALLEGARVVELRHGSSRDAARALRTLAEETP